MKTKILLSSFLLCFVLQSHGQWTHNKKSQPRNWMKAASSDTKSCFRAGETVFGNSSEVENVAVMTLIHVPADYSSIQAGINAASDGDTVLVAENTYYENINFNGKAILVASEFIMDGDTNHISNTIINGSQPAYPDSGSVVTFTSGEDTTSVLCGFTITGGTGTIVAVANGRAGGGVFIQYSGGKLLNNYIESNIVSHDTWTIGGGICAGGPITPLPWVVLRGNRINNNKAISLNEEGDGGGIESYYNLIMTDNQISYNEANGPFRGDGGGVRIRTDFGHVDLDMRNNFITYNKAMSVSAGTDLALSGGLDIFWDASGTVSNNVISFNEIEVAADKWGYGTGVLVELQDMPAPDFVFENNFVTDNFFTGGSCEGGGLCIYTSGGKFQNNVVQNNQGTNGGGIAIEYNTIDNQVMLINNTITGNVGANGGGLYVNSADVVVINTIIWGNNSQGASIFVQGSTLEVKYSDVEDVTPWPGEGNIIAAPQFLSDGYHIENSSPLVNRGISTISVNGVSYDCPWYDIDGDIRPYENTPPEIGVDEVPVLNVGESILTSSIAMKVYPNPSSGNFHLEILNENHQKTLLATLYNLQGKVVFKQSITTGKQELNVKLPDGVYLLNVLSDESTTTELITIQK